ncbi:2020_t:CDS:2 [Paraglomus brasilianum]|uniref:2020_t:CDS:1 n=1 Tax=Paraglomus brasilianum TaxID=144538 RepID=A0A9N8WHE2_9GLOM|nr:2020_t:CDS:2 [Paraglomus brasilianum]
MLHTVIRRTGFAALNNFRFQSRTPRVIRSFSVFGARRGDVSPSLIGPGAKPNSIPTDLEQATGLERAEILAKIEGQEFFDMKPLLLTHLGTKSNPILVKSVDPERYVGCTGYPADTHEMIWLKLEKEHEFDRCPECGGVYKLVFVGSDGDGGHHH